MKRAVQANNFKIPLQELSTLLDFARRRAKETGENVDFLANSIVSGIGRKSPLILDNLGISATALKDELGGASVAASSIGDVTAAVGRIARKELQGMGKDALTLKEIYLQFRTTVANSLGEIGGILAETLKPAVALARDLVKRFAALQPETKRFIVILGGVAAAIGPLLALAGTVLPAILSGLALLTGPIGLVVAGLTAIGVVIARYWEPIRGLLVDIANYFIDLYNEARIFRVVVEGIRTTFNNLLETGKFVFAVLGEIIAAVANQIKVNFTNIGDLIKAVLTGNLDEIPNILKDNLNQSVGNFKDFVNGIESDFIDLKDAISNNITEGVGRALGDRKYKLLDENVDVSDVQKKTAEAVAKGLATGRAQQSALNLETPCLAPIDTSGISDNIDNIVPSFEVNELLNGTLTALNDFNEAASQIINDEISNTFAGIGVAIGSSLVNGTNFANQLGSVLLSSLGNVAVQLGQLAIGMGKAIVAIKKSLIGLNGGLAIAAGVGLIALGTVFKAGASRLGNNFGSSSGSGSFGGPTDNNNVATTFSSSQSLNNGQIIGRIIGRDVVLVYDANQSASNRLGRDLGIQNG